MLNSKSETQLKGALVAALLVALGTLPVLSSLSVGESITAFIVSENIGATLKRSADFLTTSPLYYLVVSGVTGYLGSDELGLRSVSILFSILLFAIFFNLCETLGSRRGALFSLVLLTFSQPLLTTLYAAEPFSCAAFFLILAIRFWVSVNRRPRLLAVIGYLFSAALAIYLHYGTALTLLAGQVAIWVAADRKSRLKWRAVLSILSMFLVLVFPALLHTLDLHSRPELVKLAGGVSGPVFSWTTQGIIPDGISLVGYALVLTVALGLWGARALNSESKGSEPKEITGLALGVVWWISAILASILSAVFGHDSATVNFGTFGLVLVLGSICATRDPSRTGWVLVVLSLGLTLLNPPQHERWREMAEILRLKSEQSNLSGEGIDSAHAPTGGRPVVYIVTGLPEAEHREFYARPDAGKYLSAPFIYYAVPQRVVPVGFLNLAESLEPNLTQGYLAFKGRASALSCILPASTAATGVAAWGESNLATLRYQRTAELEAERSIQTSDAPQMVGDQISPF